LILKGLKHNIKASRTLTITWLLTHPLLSLVAMVPDRQLFTLAEGASTDRIVSVRTTLDASW